MGNILIQIQQVKSVSETKPTLHMKNIKYVLWNEGTVPLSKFCEKLFPHAKFH